jgi:hypothetical protein
MFLFLNALPKTPEASPENSTQRAIARGSGALLPLSQPQTVTGCAVNACQPKRFRSCPFHLVPIPPEAVSFKNVLASIPIPFLLSFGNEFRSTENSQMILKKSNRYNLNVRYL